VEAIKNNPETVGSAINSAAYLALGFGGPITKSIGGGVKGALAGLAYANRDNPNSWFSKAWNGSPEEKKKEDSAIKHEQPALKNESSYSPYFPSTSKQGIGGNIVPAPHNPVRNSFTLFER
jgi:hypothetical protein